VDVDAAAAVRRREDPRFLTGRARYVDDVRLPGALVAAFVRSPHAHARLVSIEAAAAGPSAGGEPHMFTASDFPELGAINARMNDGGFAPAAQWPLARDTVRYVGEPVAVVVAGDRYAAEDAAERVGVRYSPLPAVPDLEAALAPGAPRLHALADNVLYRHSWASGPAAADALRDGAVRVAAEIAMSRATALPLEGRGVVACVEDGRLTLWAGTQVPSILRGAVAVCLGLPPERVRVIVPDTGGGFGQKMHVYPEDIVVAALAMRTGRPVKWIEDRRESLTAATQARQERVHAELAAGRDGRVLALRAEICGDTGAYHVFPTTAALEPLGVAQILPGPYLVRHYTYETRAVCTNKPPTGAYRGVGMTAGVLVMERLMDMLARAVGIDPVEVRRRNLIPAEAFPYESAAGLVYDGGSSYETLDEVCRLARYPVLREEQRRLRREGRHLGIGVSCYTEYTGIGSSTFSRRGMSDIPGHETAAVRVDPAGTVRVAVSFPSQGQGHETTMAQLVAGALRVPLDRVQVEPIDTASGLDGSGTFASRTSVAGAGAVLAAADAVLDRARTIAASLLEAAPVDIEADGAGFRVRGTARGVSFEDVAKAAPRVAGGLEARAAFDPPAAVFSNAAHIAVVEVDAGTGQVSLQRYFVAEDCGRVLNPRIVEGQLHGALAQGIGGALLEHAAYGEDGQPLAATLLDYLIPTPLDVPPIQVTHVGRASPGRTGGFKGMAEGGAIGAPACIANAVSDAIGVPVAILPLTPDRVRAALASRSRERD
jgi:aerobic carbon-monoxide dehydrogenase large subunit